MKLLYRVLTAILIAQMSLGTVLLSCESYAEVISTENYRKNVQSEKKGDIETIIDDATKVESIVDPYENIEDILPTDGNKDETIVPSKELREENKKRKKKAIKKIETLGEDDNTENDKEDSSKTENKNVSDTDKKIDLKVESDEKNREDKKINDKGKLYVKVVDNENKPVTGVEFIIRDSMSLIIDILKTDVEGNVEFSELDCGIYYLEESEVPEEFEIIKERWQIYVKEDGRTEVYKLNNKEEEISSELEEMSNKFGFINSHMEEKFESIESTPKTERLKEKQYSGEEKSIEREYLNSIYSIDDLEKSAGINSNENVDNLKSDKEESEEEKTEEEKAEEEKAEEKYPHMTIVQKRKGFDSEMSRLEEDRIEYQEPEVQQTESPYCKKVGENYCFDIPLYIEKQCDYSKIKYDVYFMAEESGLDVYKAVYQGSDPVVILNAKDFFRKETLENGETKVHSPEVEVIEDSYFDGATCRLKFQLDKNAGEYLESENVHILVSLRNNFDFLDYDINNTNTLRYEDKSTYVFNINESKYGKMAFHIPDEKKLNMEEYKNIEAEINEGIVVNRNEKRYRGLNNITDYFYIDFNYGEDFENLYTNTIYPNSCMQITAIEPSMYMTQKFTFESETGQSGRKYNPCYGVYNGYYDRHERVPYFNMSYSFVKYRVTVKNDIIAGENEYDYGDLKNVHDENMYRAKIDSIVCVDENLNELGIDDDKRIRQTEMNENGLVSIYEMNYKQYQKMVYKNCLLQKEAIKNTFFSPTVTYEQYGIMFLPMMTYDLVEHYKPNRVFISDGGLISERSYLQVEKLKKIALDRMNSSRGILIENNEVMEFPYDMAKKIKNDELRECVYPCLVSQFRTTTEEMKDYKESYLGDVTAFPIEERKEEKLKVKIKNIDADTKKVIPDSSFKTHVISESDNMNGERGKFWYINEPDEIAEMEFERPYYRTYDTDADGIAEVNYLKDKIPNKETSGSRSLIIYQRDAHIGYKTNKDEFYKLYEDGGKIYIEKYKFKNVVDILKKMEMVFVESVPGETQGIFSNCVERKEYNGEEIIVENEKIVNIKTDKKYKFIINFLDNDKNREFLRKYPTKEELTDEDFKKMKVYDWCNIDVTVKDLEHLEKGVIAEKKCSGKELNHEIILSDEDMVFSDYLNLDTYDEYGSKVGKEIYGVKYLLFQSSNAYENSPDEKKDRKYVSPESRGILVVVLAKVDPEKIKGDEKININAEEIKAYACAVNYWNEIEKIMKDAEKNNRLNTHWIKDNIISGETFEEVEYTLISLNDSEPLTVSSDDEEIELDRIFYGYMWAYLPRAFSTKGFKAVLAGGVLAAVGIAGYIYYRKKEKRKIKS